MVAEAAEGPDRFGCAEGPFWDYERTVETEAIEGGLRVTERITYELAIPGWGWIFRVPVRRRLARPSPDSAWWMPPDRIDADTALALDSLCALTLIAGYTGTLIAQTITFAADEFGASDQAQGAALAATRVGVLLALVLVAAADRRGRRRLIQVSAYGACALAATGAFAPNLVGLGISQTLARGLSTALALLIAILAAELVPRNSRAWTVSILALTGGPGLGDGRLAAAARRPRRAGLAPALPRPPGRHPVHPLWWSGGCPSRSASSPPSNALRSRPTPLASGSWPRRPSSARSSWPRPASS